MSSIVKAGVVLGVLVAIWTYVMGFTGWYKDPALTSLFWVVVLINVGVLIWGLRETAKQGKRYWGQVGAGTLMGVIGAVIILVNSFLFTTVVFPEYLQEIRAMQIDIFEAQNIPQEQLDMQIKMMDAMMTPTLQALFGFLGTVVTSFVASLIIAAFVREK